MREHLWKPKKVLAFKACQIIIHHFKAQEKRGNTLLAEYLELLKCIKILGSTDFLFVEKTPIDGLYEATNL